jgi:hypothetical protein
VDLCVPLSTHGAVGIRLEPAAAIVRQYGEQFRGTPTGTASFGETAFGTAAELGVRQLPWVEAHPVNGWNPDFSLCSRGSVHPGTPNSAAVPHGLGQSIDSSCFSDRHFRHGGYDKAGLGDHAAIADQDDMTQGEALFELGDLHRQRRRVTGSAVRGDV